MKVESCSLVGVDSTPYIIEVKNQENLINKTAQEIFSTDYANLFKLKHYYTNKLSELEGRKRSLKNTWTYYCFSTKYVFSKCYFTTFVTGVALWAISTLTTIYVSFRLNNETIVGAGVSGALLSFPASVAVGFCCHVLPCVKKTLHDYKVVKQEINQIQTDTRHLIQIIEFTNAFAEFSKECSQLKTEIDGERVKELFGKFERLDRSYNTYKDSNNYIGKWINKDLMRLMPLFLMHAISEIDPASSFASDWKQFMENPSFWNSRKDNRFWSRMGIKTPLNDTYVEFSKKTIKSIDIDLLKEQFQKKINSYIAKRQSLFSDNSSLNQIN